MIRERIKSLVTKMLRLARRNRTEAAMDAEMQFHFDQLVADFRAQGFSERDARLAARREFGAVDAYREEIRETWIPAALTDGWRSVCFAVRSLGRNPVFTVIAIATLALGIGANTAMFSVINTVALKPLPYPDSFQLDLIRRSSPQDFRGAIAAADFLDLRAAQAQYGEIAAYAVNDVSLAPPGAPADFAPALRVTSNFFSVLGIPPVLGRDFTDRDEQVGHDRVLVLSHRCWQVRFAGAADVLGTTVRVDGEPHVIVGVLPEAFNEWRHLGWVDLFRPLALTNDQARDRANRWLNPIGRRDRSVSEADGGAFIAGFGERLAREFPEFNHGSAWHVTPIDFVRKGETGGVALAMMIGLSGFVLLIACSNLANFQLARTISRAREFAVRGALGASRSQLLRPLAVECLLLACIGGVLSIIVALWITDWFTGRSTDDVGEQVIFALDWKVLAWASAVSVITALSFGLAPALYALRLDLNETLKSGGRAATGGRGHQRLRHCLIVGQFALAMILLAGAALFIRGLDALNNHRSGWESDQLVTGTVLLPAAQYADADARLRFQERLLERISVLPGVTSASVSRHLPFFGWRDSIPFTVEGQPLPEPGREPAALVNTVSADYFTTVRTAWVAGRMFDRSDTLTSTPVAIINESLARTLFGGADALGKRLKRVGGAEEPAVIVGIVADVKSVNPDRTAVVFQLYRPSTQDPTFYNEIAVRTAATAPPNLLLSIRSILTELDSDLPVRNLKWANDRIARSNYQIAVLRDILTAFAVLGLGLASIGIYGVIERLMAQRTMEFGVRLALGAQVRDITRLVLTSGMKLAFIGCGLGLLGAAGISKLIAATFPQMELNHGAVLTAVTFFLTVVGLVAAYLPARRAARINPVEALRSE
jgi:putative ABC transport system permease protein